jgi:Ca2+-binding EF-hand superfamily protein
MKRNSFVIAVASGLVAFGLAATAGAQAPAAKPAVKPATTSAPSLPPEIDAAFAAWDVDHNGALSQQEFRNGWMMLRRAAMMQQRLHEQFNTIDANKNGGIDAGEYSNLLLVKKAGKSAPLLSAFDANKDQRLEFPEYLEFVRRMEAAQPATATPAPAKSP